MHQGSSVDSGAGLKGLAIEAVVFTGLPANEQVIEITRDRLAGVIKELNRPISEDETHRTLRSSCSIPYTARLRLVEVNSQDVMFLAPVHLDGIVRRQPAQDNRAL